MEDNTTATVVFFSWQTAKAKESVNKILAQKAKMTEKVVDMFADSSDEE